MPRGIWKRQRLTPEERFWAKVDKNGPNGCWIWLGTRNNWGYGHFWLNKHKGHMIFAHRFAYELLRTLIPEGMTIDHLCHNPACVNPDHLEVVTVKDNILRGNGNCARNAQKTHCPKGHPYDLFNTKFRADGHRACLACRGTPFTKGGKE